jgi:hypothetical protein
MNFKDITLADISTETKVETLGIVLDKKLEELSSAVYSVAKKKGEQGDKGEKGDKGDKGEQGVPGKDSKDGINGKDGKDGVDGKDGEDGLEAPKIIDAEVALDDTLLLTLSDGTEIKTTKTIVGQRGLGGANGSKGDKGDTGLGLITGGTTGQYLRKASSTDYDTSWGTLSTVATSGAYSDLSGTPALGTIATQNANAVAITGGTINGTTIGATTPATGKFSTLEATGNSTLGTGSSQYIQVEGGATAVLLSAQGAGTNIPLALQPKGTGALQAQATTSTTAGGNARGANAVDWQTSRVAASQVASGQYSFIGGGIGNTSNGTVTTVAGGNGNVVGGIYAGVLSGISNTVSGFGAAVVTGYTNTAAGHLNFIGGGFTNSGTANAAVTTQSGTMNGTTAVTLSGSNANIKVGQYITGTSITTFPSTYVAAISGTSLTLSQNASGSSTSTLSFFTPHGVVVGGGNNQATGSYSFIGGGGDAGTAANRNVASGDWSVVAGGQANTSSGTYSTIIGGRNNTASSGDAIVAGTFSTSSSTGSMALGYNATANGVVSSVIGGRYGTTRIIAGNTVFSACNIPIGLSGVSQSALLVLARETTDATATALTSNTSAATTTNQVILPNNSAYFFTGEIISGVTGGGNTKGFTIEGVIKRGANAASTALVGTPTVTSMYADVGAATWAIAVTADTTNGGIRVTFTGQAATTIRTVCQIRTTEMTF